MPTEFIVFKFSYCFLLIVLLILIVNKHKIQFQKNSFQLIILEEKMRISIILIILNLFSFNVIARENSSAILKKISDCSFLLNYAAAVSAEKDDKAASAYYTAAGAVTQLINELEGNFAVNIAQSVARHQLTVEDDNLLINEIESCESFINLNTEILNRIGSKYQVPPNLHFDKSTLRKKR